MKYFYVAYFVPEEKFIVEYDTPQDIEGEEDMQIMTINNVTNAMLIDYILYSGDIRKKTFKRLLRSLKIQGLNKYARKEILYALITGQEVVVL